MKNEKKRKLWLDMAKGVAIILMVVGHTPIPRVASDFIYAFHMPLFFIASGFTSDYAKHKTIWSYVKHKTRTIMLPFVIYSVIVVCLMLLVDNKAVVSLSGGWGGYALWFIPVLYLASIIAMSVSGIKVSVLRYGAIAFLLLLGTCLDYCHVILPWAMSTVPYAAFSCLWGNILRNYQKWIETERHYWDIALLFVITVVISLFWRLDMAWNHITPVLPLTIGAFAGTLMVFRLSVLIERRMRFLATVLQNVGRETYIVVAFSQVTIMLINHFFTINPLLKYVFLVAILVMLKYVKDGINRILKNNIL